MKRTNTRHRRLLLLPSALPQVLAAVQMVVEVVRQVEEAAVRM